MFPEPTELRLIGCLTESIWNPTSKSKMVDSKNQLADILTERKKHVMNGTIFYVYSTSAFSALQASFKRCRKGRKKETVRKELPPNGNQWEIWCREAFAGYSTVQNSTASASHGNFTPENHELGLIAGTGQPVAEKRIQKPESNESDRRWNFSKAASRRKDP